MATIGMDRLYYAKITEASDGEETYGVPAPLAKAMKAELSIELAEAVLYADDGAAEKARREVLALLADKKRHNVRELDHLPLSRSQVDEALRYLIDEELIHLDGTTISL